MKCLKLYFHLSDMVKDKSEYDKSDANVGTRMKKIISEKYKEEIQLKFTAFEAFLAKKAGSNRLARGFIMRRIITFILVSRLLIHPSVSVAPNWRISALEYRLLETKRS